MSSTFLGATQKKAIDNAKKTEWSLCDSLRFYA